MAGEKLAALNAAIQRINDLTRDGYGAPVTAAREASMRRIAIVDRLKIYEEYNNRPDEQTKALAARCKSLMKAQEEKAAPAALRKALKGFALELETLRAALPSLAAAAAVEIGAAARALASEAEGL